MRISAKGGGWRLMSAADLNEHAQDFITQYNENGGIAVIKKYKSGNCCFAVKGGKKLAISGTAYNFQFPSDAKGAIVCSPPSGYAAEARLLFYKAPRLALEQTFSAVSACITNHNPGIFIKLPAAPPASACGSSSTWVQPFSSVVPTRPGPTMYCWTSSAVPTHDHRCTSMCAPKLV